MKGSRARWPSGTLLLDTCIPSEPRNEDPPTPSHYCPIRRILYCRFNHTMSINCITRAHIFPNSFNLCSSVEPKIKLHSMEIHFFLCLCSTEVSHNQTIRSANKRIIIFKSACRAASWNISPWIQFPVHLHFSSLCSLTLEKQKPMQMVVLTATQ